MNVWPIMKITQSAIALYKIFTMPISLSTLKDNGNLGILLCLYLSIFYIWDLLLREIGLRGFSGLGNIHSHKYK